MANKFIFLDRDGTLVNEPADLQLDSFDKFSLKKDVLWALKQCIKADFKLVMVTNQDGLGTASFPEENFTALQNLFLQICASQGILFEAVFICPHFIDEQCQCRKPKTGLVTEILQKYPMDKSNSYMIGDRVTDLGFGEALGIKGILVDENTDWLKLANELLQKPRMAEVKRKTTETSVQVTLN